MFSEELREAARADAGGAGEFGDGGGTGGLVEVGQGIVDGGVAAVGFAFAETVKEGEIEEVEFACRGGGFAEVVAEVGGGAAPEIFERGFAVGEEVGVVGEEGECASRVEEDTDEFAEVDGVDLLVMGVDA